MTAARQAAAARAVKMTPELITPSALVRPCMNGARQRKNVFARRAINILVREPDMQVVKVIAATTNIKSVNALVDTHGMRRPELVSAAALINTPALAVISPAGRVRLVAENIPPANAQPVSHGIHPAACASATALTGVRSIKTALV